ncbi:MAG: type II toxin-antitoxin system HicA family toxin [Methanosarcinales archaeon]
MPKLPVLSAKEVLKVLRKFGFRVYRQTGSHIHYSNNLVARVIVV